MIANSTVHHVNWLIRKKDVITSDDKTVYVYELEHKNEDVVKNAWAKHFRSHYCDDDMIDVLRDGTGYSRSEYLTNLKFPDIDERLGKATRSGDFGEILLADFLEYVLKYWVPRTRYSDKKIRNESPKGSDVVGFKFVNEKVFSINDVLIIFESKAQFAGATVRPTLQLAVNDSIKDESRKADSLNAMKQRLIELGRSDEALKISRFQDKSDNSYKECSGAAAILTTEYFSEDEIKKVVSSIHPNKDNLLLLIIHGKNMDDLKNDLYRRAADGA